MRRHPVVDSRPAGVGGCGSGGRRAELGEDGAQRSDARRQRGRRSFDLHDAGMIEDDG
jgi:hypothetical protein